MASAIDRFQHVAVTVSDIDRSLRFYRDTLGFRYEGRLNYRDARGLVIDFLDMGNGTLLELFSFEKSATKPTEWIDDDTQTGLRHVGFVVEDVDAMAARLQEQGVEFKLQPFNAHGGVRIAFFRDPDGTLLELVQGSLDMDVPGDAPYPRRIPAATSNGLVYDHVAVTVESLKDTVAFYREQLGAVVVGELTPSDSRGFRITYMELGGAVLEFFSFDVPTRKLRWNRDETVLGLKHLGLEVSDVRSTAKTLFDRGVVPIYQPNDALGDVVTCFFEDAEGNALELISGTCTYDQ